MKFFEEVLAKIQAEGNYVFPQPDNFYDELPNLVYHQEEPFAGSSIYAQWCVMRLAREQGIVVMLDGQGGDEQLCGYRKFHIFYLIELLKQFHPQDFIKESLCFLYSPAILGTLNIRSGLRYFKFGERLQNLEGLLRSDFGKEFAGERCSVGYGGGLSNRIKLDLTRFSLPVLLRYEDKNSMAHSVESRLPFLDYRLVENLASAPLDQKIRNGWTKYLLREALKGVLPEKVRLRKSKRGFVTPEDQWFRKTLESRVKRVFRHATFLPNYVNMLKLEDRYNNFLSRQVIDVSEIFFRFFITELWGQLFIQNMPILRSRL